MQRCSGTTNFISIHLMFLLIPERIQKYPQIIYFNTSHVSINRLWYLRSLRSSPISIHLMFLLILSRSHSFSFTDNNFNTSHVSINLLHFIHALRELFHFNTSHVSINLSSDSTPLCTSNISIHLMFLLIGAAAERERAAVPEFQYISCFY